MMEIELYIDVPFDDPRVIEAFQRLPLWVFESSETGGTRAIPDIPTRVMANGILKSLGYAMNLLTWKSSLPEPVGVSAWNR